VYSAGSGPPNIFGAAPLKEIWAKYYRAKIMVFHFKNYVVFKTSGARMRHRELFRA